MRTVMVSLFVLLAAGCDRGGSGSSSGTGSSQGGHTTVCTTDPQGDACQQCLATARSACLGRGVCSAQYESFEFCMTQACVDPEGQPTTGCCNGRNQALTACLNASCSDWNTCLGR